ncbi:MAG: sulfite exporter TauE/SafE family protein [Bacteroidota bacterium]
MAFGAAFLIGFFGSIHCLGMCGPLALALPFGSRSPWQRAGKALAYNAGRIATYTLMGVLLGGVGQGIWLAGLQRTATIVFGVLLVVSLPLLYRFEQRMWSTAFYQKWSVYIQKGFGRLFRSQSPLAIPGLGALNGLLPCGMVYMALAGALTQNGPINGAAFMFAFGLGTLPMMMAAILLGKTLLRHSGNLLRPLLYVSVWLIGLLSVLRGLQLELPTELDFLLVNNAVMCH